MPVCTSGDAIEIRQPTAFMGGFPDCRIEKGSFQPILQGVFDIQ